MDNCSSYLTRKMPTTRDRLRTPLACGFTLVEILVAIIILTIGILAVSHMTVMGMKVNTVVNKRMHARVVLAQVFEDLNNQPSDAPDLLDPDGAGDLDDDSLGDHSQTITCQANRYSYRARWNVADNVPETNIKTIRIHVLWGSNEEYKLTTDLIKRM